MSGLLLPAFRQASIYKEERPLVVAREEWLLEIDNRRPDCQDIALQDPTSSFSER
jgi:hypothetical protein